MHEYSPEELDLMAQAYERACEELSKIEFEWPSSIETARSHLVDGIVEAMERGLRNVDTLIVASLSKLDSARPGLSSD